ncbi:MAG: hypothetical protein ACRD3T_18485 [Terriglobia bacterium]
MKLKTGQYVRHSKFGWGAIVEVDREKTMVYFHTVGIKTLPTSQTTFDVVQDLGPKKGPAS